jgi:hypothetical protein
MGLHKHKVGRESVSPSIARRVPTPAGKGLQPATLKTGMELASSSPALMPKPFRRGLARLLFPDPGQPGVFTRKDAVRPHVAFDSMETCHPDPIAPRGIGWRLDTARQRLVDAKVCDRTCLVFGQLRRVAFGKESVFSVQGAKARAHG